MAFAQCIHDFSTSYGLPLSLLLVGLVGGVTHCAGICSPFVLAQLESGPHVKRFSALLLPYHLGRTTTYVFLAVLVHSFINLAFVFSHAKALISAPLLMMAGTLFIVSAFPRLSALFPWVGRFVPKLPFNASLIARLSSGSNPFKRYVLGILLGFMPCGMVVSALMASATAHSVYQAAFAMAAFAAGTVPALVIVALGGQTLKKKYPEFSTKLSRGAMVVSATWLFVLAGMLVF